MLPARSGRSLRPYLVRSEPCCLVLDAGCEKSLPIEVLDADSERRGVETECVDHAVVGKVDVHLALDSWPAVSDLCEVVEDSRFGDGQLPEDAWEARRHVVGGWVGGVREQRRPLGGQRLVLCEARGLEQRDEHVVGDVARLAPACGEDAACFVSTRDGA